jgi:hypothetical protein
VYRASCSHVVRVSVSQAAAFDRPEQSAPRPRSRHMQRVAGEWDRCAHQLLYRAYCCGALYRIDYNAFLLSHPPYASFYILCVQCRVFGTGLRVESPIELDRSMESPESGTGAHVNYCAVLTAVPPC